MKVAVDGVLFGYDYTTKDLKVLLIKRKYEPYKDQWAFCGGFCLESESLDDAIVREIYEETNIDISSSYLEQLYTFGSPNRDPRERVVSVAYYSLIDPKQYEIYASTDASDTAWFTLKEINDIELSFDHKMILDTAITRLKSKIKYQPIGFNLLPEQFSLPMLQQIYETISGTRYDRRNFRKKVLNLCILVKIQTINYVIYYRFDKNKYKEKVEQGIYFEI